METNENFIIKIEKGPGSMVARRTDKRSKSQLVSEILVHREEELEIQKENLSRDFSTQTM